MRRKRARSARHWIGEPGKVVVRISPDAWKRLDEIKEKYGFKSIYEIMQYLVGAFLRVADPEHEEPGDPVPDEIAEMFGGFAQAEKRFEYVKPKRSLSQYEIDNINGQRELKFTE